MFTRSDSVCQKSTRILRLGITGYRGKIHKYVKYYLLHSSEIARERIGDLSICAYQLVDDLSSTTLCQAATKASLFFVRLIDMFIARLIHNKFR